MRCGSRNSLICIKSSYTFRQKNLIKLELSWGAIVPTRCTWRQPSCLEDKQISSLGPVLMMLKTGPLLSVSQEPESCWLRLWLMD